MSSSYTTYSFFDHPNRVCMSYFSHFTLSMKFSFMFLKASGAAIIHAIFPSLFITNTTDTHNQIGYLLDHSGCRNEEHVLPFVRQNLNNIELDQHNHTHNTHTNTNAEILFRV